MVALRILLRLFVIAGATYGGLLGLITLTQRALLYFPTTERVPPDIVPGRPAGLVEVTIDTPDGERLVAWHRPADPGQPTILFFNGNAGHLPWTMPRFRLIAERGLGLLAPAYRGYSGSTGRPTEEGLHRDAEAAYAWLAARVPPGEIILHGLSLGSGVATRLATARPARLLVLEAPFTAVVDIAARQFWFFPVRQLMTDTFVSRDWIGAVRMPILIVHGARDGLIPIADGRALFALAPEPKRFVAIAEAGHDDVWRFGLMDEIARSLDAIASGAARPGG
jgi:hypothetical protein